MAPSERTVKKLMAESENAGGKVYHEGEDALEEDVTHLEEDDDPLTLVGDADDDGEKLEENS